MTWSVDTINSTGTGTGRGRTPARPGPGPTPEALLRALDLTVGRRIRGLLTGEYRAHDLGGGTELEAMRQLAKDLGIADYVTFTGRVPDAELLEMLNTADICVNPDRANDMNDRSTMNKVMEYMALAKPIVQFDLTEGRVSAGEASWYARPNDVADLAQKIVALLGDENQRIHMGAIGRQRVEQVLAWQHEAPRLLAAYEHMTGDRS